MANIHGTRAHSIVGNISEGRNLFVPRCDSQDSCRVSVFSWIPNSQSGDPFQGVIDQVSVAVPKLSAVGQSQSNSRAERSVQTVENIVRTFKSALEARIASKVPSSSALTYWASHDSDTFSIKKSAGEKNTLGVLLERQEFVGKLLKESPFVAA